MQWRACLLAVCLAGSTGCWRAENGVGGESADVAGDVMSREGALRSFQEELEPVSQLESSYTSRDELMAGLVQALGARDTAALVAMAVTPAEFGYLYYPTNPQGLPPYDLSPGLMWHMLHQRSDQGVRRALAVYGGRPLQLQSHDCGDESSLEGQNTVAGPCVLRLRDAQGASVSLQFPSQVIERAGRYKVLSYANQL